MPPKHEVEFTIYLVPGTSLVQMLLYKMFASELSELKKQLEDLLEKKFVRPNVIVGSTDIIGEEERW